MNDQIIQSCGACGAPLAPGATECAECRAALDSGVSIKSGGILSRVGAGIVDALLLLAVLALVLVEGFPWWSIFVAIAVLITFGYVLRGSLGKSLFGLSVEVAPRWRYFIREIIGKLASSLIFGIGFLMMFGKDGLALHDLIAKSRVVRVRRMSPAIQGLRTLLLVAVVGIVAFLGAHFGSGIRANKTPATQTAGSGGSLDAITSQIPAVLTIYCYDRHDKLQSQGSGFLINGSGGGVTNFHVLQSAYRAEAQLGDGRLFQVLKIDAFDKDRDIVILQLGRIIDGRAEWPTDLPFLSIGSSENISVGDRVATVSSPEGLANSVTDGLVSAVRKDDPSDSFIQISAPISPGSSGGPVFDLAGRVIAVNVAQFREGQNLNFAIPIEAVTELSKQEQAVDFGTFRDWVFAQAKKSRGQFEQSATNAQTTETATAPAPPEFNGLYAGVLHNEAANLTANFGVLVKNTNGAVEGCLGVKKPLYGSGPLHGTTDGQQLNFIVQSVGFIITFDGTIKDNEISGTYTVSPMNGSSQEGEFDAEKDKGKDAPPTDLTNCPTDEDMNSP